MKFIPFKKLLTLSIFIIGLFPVSTFASRIYLETPTKSVNVGDTIVVNVKIDTEKATINVIEGSINFAGNENILEVKDISTAGSASSVWPVLPTLSSDSKSIPFNAGIAQGLNSSDATLFKIILLAVKTGSLNLTTSNLSSYLSDGKGTMVSTSGTPLEIIVNDLNKNIPTNEWDKIKRTDTTPPDPFTVSFGKDDSVFDGKKFISFNAMDNESGIDYYEVIEGDLEPVRSTNTYILKNQENPSKIIVTAYDKAGNSRVTILDATSKTPTYIITGILIFVISLYMIYRLYIKARRWRVK